MTSTNWPNPERPGEKCRPPENTKSETWHWLDCGYLAPFAWREKDGGAWWSNDGKDNLFSPDQMAGFGWSYVGPCLTPAQINEMLAAERERAVSACLSQKEVFESPEYAGDPLGAVMERFACDQCIEEIRNLGAAP